VSNQPDPLAGADRHGDVLQRLHRPRLDVPAAERAPQHRLDRVLALGSHLELEIDAA
jgi:hypothetical protein